MTVYAKSRFFEPGERLRMRRERLASGDEQIVGKHVEFAARDQLRIELPDRAGGCIPRISKTRFALLFSFGVCSLKHVEGNENFATHFERCVDALRCGLET